LRKLLVYPSELYRNGLQQGKYPFQKNRRTVITSGLVFLSVLAMVIFGGEVLRGFSLALLIGVAFGTYSSVAIASPIMVWWQERLDAAKKSITPAREANSAGSRRPQRARTAGAAGNR